MNGDERADQVEGRPAADDENDVLDVLEELGSEDQVCLYSVGDGERAYLATIDAADFSLDMVARVYGPGRYRVRCKDARGQWVRGGSRQFRIGEQLANANGARGAPAADASMPPWLPALLEALKPPPAPAAPASDPVKLIADIGTIAAQQTASMMGMIQALVPAMMKGGRGPGMSPAQLMDVVMRAAELGGRGSGGGGGASVLADLGPRVLDLIERASGQQQLEQLEAGEAGDGAAPAPTNPKREAPVPIPVPAADTPFAQLAPHMPQLLGLARKRANVKVWAITIDASQPDAVDVLYALTDRLGFDQVCELLRETFPEQLQDADVYRWFRALLGELIQIRQEAENDGGDE